VSNASAFLAGHEAQYDIGLGLLDLLLDQQPQPSTPSALMVLVVPVLAWLVVAALLAALARDLARLRVHGLPAQRRRGARGWVRALLPGAVLIASGGGLLIAAPLGLAPTNPPARPPIRPRVRPKIHESSIKATSIPIIRQPSAAR
jgi:hypothetical protein